MKSSSPTEKSRFGWIAVAAVAGVLCAALIWWVRMEKGPFKIGEREKEWLEEISYQQNPEQSRQWEERGEAGVRGLSRSMADGATVPEKLCRQGHPKLPDAARWMLPAPENPVGDS